MIVYLRVQAPFAAYRPLTAGWFRPSAAMMTPSAAYGLVLNLAAIDSRVIETDPQHDGSTPASLTKTDLPPAKIALGIPESSRAPVQQTVLQQLHNYPIGKDAGVPKEWAKGNKNNISPIKREFLSDLDVLIGVDANESFCERIAEGLEGGFNERRYGLPFLGDNSFLIDRVELLKKPIASRWYEKVESQSPKKRRMNDGTRLTTYVDRGGFSGTRSAVYVSTEEATLNPSEAAWSVVGSAPHSSTPN